MIIWQTEGEEGNKEIKGDDVLLGGSTIGIKDDKITITRTILFSFYGHTHGIWKFPG